MSAGHCYTREVRPTGGKCEDLPSDCSASSPPILVLGAGLAGLSAAYHLAQTLYGSSLGSGLQASRSPGDRDWNSGSDPKPELPPGRTQDSGANGPRSEAQAETEGKEARPEIWLVEAQSEVGGHARSHRREGYTFDITGHWLHLRDPEMQSLVRRLDPELSWLQVQRQVEIYCAESFIPYPFQHNLHALPPRERQACLDAFLKRPGAAHRSDPPGEPINPANFGEFVRQRFGEGMETLFFRPYNERLWDAPLESLTCDWMSRFLPVPQAQEILEGAKAAPSQGIGYNASFIYPKVGGIDHLPRAFVRHLDQIPQLHLRCNSKLLALDPKNRRAKISIPPQSAFDAQNNPTANNEEPGGTTGTWIPYHAVISTLPLPELCGRIEGLPPTIQNESQSLSWARWRYLDVALKAPPPRKSHWIYVPERRFPFFRVGCPTNVCPANAPPGGATLYVELADREAPLDQDHLIESLMEVGMLGHVDDIDFIEERRVDYAYVRFDHKYAGSREAILNHLSNLGVYSCGRYGSWVYQSMEDSMIEGRDAARRLLRDCGLCDVSEMSSDVPVKAKPKDPS